MRRSQICYWTLTITALINAQCADAAIIDDASFFDNIPHTFVDFETRDDGSPLPLEEGQFAFAPLDEYFEIGFVAFGMNIAWEWSANPDVQQALTIGATPTILLRMFPNSPGTNFGFVFPEDQHAIGLFVARDTRFASEPLTITVKTRHSDLIETLTVTGALIDGAAGSIEYGYVGITSPLGIATITFSGQNIFAFGFDDFRFSRVPSPSTVVPLVLFTFFTLRRRR